MAYTITIKKRHHEIAEGTTAKAITEEGKTMYKFESDTDLNDYVSFSWDHIKSHKEYFSVSNSSE